MSPGANISDGVTSYLEPPRRTSFPPRIDYNKLSLNNLLDARATFHAHLTQFPNVIATAVGLKRFYADGPGANGPIDAESKLTNETPKTLFNSVVRPWSWPVILVFVDQWLTDAQIANDPRALIPPLLYYAAPGGEHAIAVPTCVIQLPTVAQTTTQAQDIVGLPITLIGGGNALQSTVQGRQRFGSVGCLVTDGQKTYALTNQHVAGAAGATIFAQFRQGQLKAVGTGSPLMLRKAPFAQIYPQWDTADTSFANIDAGLIDVDDQSMWTTQVQGLGRLGRLANLDESSFTLDLIDCPVRAFGAASGDLTGRIAALFYRYKSMAGRDYLADFLIMPDTNADSTDHFTRPGDSGTVWSLVVTDETSNTPSYRPIAMEWGGHTVEEGRTTRACALATNLSAILRELDLDIVTGWNDNLPNYWGELGHYTIAGKAVDLAVNAGGTYGKFFGQNRDLITFDAGHDQLTYETLKQLDDPKSFCPLADVPDLVWKPPMAGHKPLTGSRGDDERGNHFADMDRPDPEQGNQTLLQLTASTNELTDGSKVTPQVFQRYVEDLKASFKDEKRNTSPPGLLPFRIRQLFDEMVDAADEDHYLVAAGVLAHYVGDACQPLHCSYQHDGDPARSVERTIHHRDGTDSTKTQPYGSGVHSAFETTMIDAHNADVGAGIDRLLGLAGGPPATDFASPLPPISTGLEAACAAIDLMRRTFKRISPADLVNEFATNGAASLWDTFGEDTIAVQADGARLLEHLWTQAWNLNTRAFSDQQRDKDTVRQLYQDPDVCKSYTLDTVEAALKVPAHA